MNEGASASASADQRRLPQSRRIATAAPAYCCFQPVAGAGWVLPFAANSATRRSLAVSESGPAPSIPRGRTPTAASSVRARRSSARAPHRDARVRPSSSGSRAAVRFPAARSIAPRSTSTRACSSRAGEAANTASAAASPSDRCAGGRQAHARAKRCRSLAAHRTTAHAVPRRQPALAPRHGGRARPARGPRLSARGTSPGSRRRAPDAQRRSCATPRSQLRGCLPPPAARSTPEA